MSLPVRRIDDSFWTKCNSYIFWWPNWPIIYLVNKLSYECNLVGHVKFNIFEVLLAFRKK